MKRTYLQVWAGLTALIIGSYFIALAHKPLWQTDQFSDAPLDANAVSLKAGKELIQTVIPEHTSTSFVLVRVTRLPPEGALTLRLEQETTILATAASGPPQATETFPHTGEKHLPAGWWVPFHFPTVSVEPHQPLKLRIQAQQEARIARELDASLYPQGSLVYDQRDRPGQIGFALMSRLPRSQALAFQLTDSNKLALVIWIVGLTSLVAFLSQLRPSQPMKAVPLLLLGLAAIYTLPLYHNVSGWGGWDWPEAASHYAAAQHSLQARQFPWWNPYMCGGTALWHDPQVYWPSLAFGLVLLFGAAAGTKLAITVYLALGLVGMYFLMRRLKLSEAASILGALVFMGSGFLTSHLVAGQMLWLTVAWIPWVIFFFLNSFVKPRHIILAALAYLLILFEGRVYISAYLVLLLPLLALSARGGDVSWQRIARTITLFGLLVAGLGAIKILPTAMFLLDTGSSLTDSPPIPLTRIDDVLLTRNVSLDYTTEWSREIPWHEYAAYVGLVPLLLALWGIGHSVMRRRASLWLTILVSGLIFLGMATGKLPLLTYLPIFDQLHNPGRAILIVTLSLALFAGYGLDQVLSLIKAGRLRPLVGLTIALLVFTDVTLLAAGPLTTIFTQTPTRFTDEALFRQNSGHADGATHVVQAGYGARDFCSPHARTWHEDAEVLTPDDPGYRGPVFAENDQADVSLAAFTPNRLMVDIGAVRNEDTLVINQRYDRGWYSPGRSVDSIRGLPALLLGPADSHTTIELSYRPPLFWWGSAITLTTSLALAGFGLRYAEKRPVGRASKRID